MRFATRSILAALSAAALASCTDSLSTSPASRTRATLAIVPRFSHDAANISATLAEAGLDFDHVRIVIVRPASDTLKDTTIVFTPTSSQVTLELSVLAVPAEALQAAIQFTQAGQVMFSGTAPVKAISGTQSATATPVAIEVQYAGPGATATNVTIAPGAGVYSLNSTTAFTAKVFAGTVELPGTPILWSVSNEALATISATGVLTPKGARGTVRVRARSPNGAERSIEVHLAPAAVGLRVVQGASQRGAPGSVLPLPVIIEAIGPDGLAATTAGLVATFSANGGASIAPTSVAFDANGRAQATMTLGNTPGTTYLYTVTAGAFSLSWGGITAVGVPTHFVPSGSTTLTMQAGVVPDPIPTLRVADAQENSVPGLFLKVTIRQGAANFVPSFNVPADSIGLLEVYRIAPTIAGAYTVLIEADPSLAIPSVTYSVTIIPGPASKLGFLQQPSGIASGQTMTPALTVAIQDRFGNTVTTASGTISLSIDPAGPTDWALGGTGSASTVNGVATFSNLQVTTSSLVVKTGMRIQAVGAGLAPTLSAGFNITP